KHKLLVEYDTGDVNDTHALASMAIQTKELLGVESMMVLADKGYHTGEELEQCHINDIITFVSPKAPLYIPVENHTKFQLKTIPLINAYLHSFFTNERRIKNDKYEYKTEDHSSQVPRWLFRTQDSPGIKDKQGNCSSLPG
ncbi:MAG: hypothetical protein GXZ19_13700, partial [Bacteroidales bacterium]|nr:hypothetical protein [Bacteroidales bacterium]